MEETGKLKFPKKVKSRAWLGISAYSAYFLCKKLWIAPLAWHITLTDDGGTVVGRVDLIVFSHVRHTGAGRIVEFLRILIQHVSCLRNIRIGCLRFIRNCDDIATAAAETTSAASGTSA